MRHVQDVEVQEVYDSNPLHHEGVWNVEDSYTSIAEQVYNKREPLNHMPIPCIMYSKRYHLRYWYLAPTRTGETYIRANIVLVAPYILVLIMKIGGFPITLSSSLHLYLLT